MNLTYHEQLVDQFFINKPVITLKELLEYIWAFEDIDIEAKYFLAKYIEKNNE